jgi:hypothetical protein
MKVQSYFRKFISSNGLFYIVLAGFILRLLFLLKGASLYYGAGNKAFINNDSASYTLSFINLLVKGAYTFNPDNPEAAFGRLPGYPLFWGLHFLFYGKEKVYLAVAITQIILDCISIILIYKIVKSLTSNVRASITAAIIYAAYPFIIVWTTITGTELLGSFVTLLFFYNLFILKESLVKPMIIGVNIALAFYIREYLGILIVCSIIYYFNRSNLKDFFFKSTYICFVFFIFYIPWPIRNYILSNKLILIKTVTAGYDRYSVDVASCRAWIYCWSTDADFYLSKIASTDEIDFIPKSTFTSEADEKLFFSALTEARHCGSGFYNWKTNKRLDQENCNADLAKQFEKLKSNYIKNNLFKYYTSVPLKNILKAFFKNDLTEANYNLNSSTLKSLSVPVLFIYRSILVVLGFITCFVYIRKREIKVILFFTSFMYLFISCIIRQVEMRYLLQADIILLIPTSLLITNLVSYLKDKKSEKYEHFKY